MPIALNDTYTTMQPLSVIELVHPSMPSYFGTSYNAKLPHYAGAEVDAGLGYTLTRASTYRLLIEDRFLNYSTGTTPTIRFNCRVLDNKGDPT